MSNHTGPVCACQDHAHPPRGETPAAPSSTSPDTIDRRLVQRYGTALLTGGYTALPTYAWVYYARLGVTEAEMVCLAQLCTYWWSARAPYPGEAALAARMGKTVRTIQGYLRSLEAKGFLHIETRLSNHGQQRTNSYDLRPFFAAVEGLARLDGLLDNAAAPELSPLNHESVACAEQGPLCAGARNSGTDNRPTSDGTSTGEGGEGSRPRGAKKPSSQVNPIEEDFFDLDSIPPTPTNTSPSATSATTTPPRPATRDRLDWLEEKGSRPPRDPRKRTFPHLRQPRRRTTRSRPASRPSARRSATRPPRRARPAPARSSPAPGSPPRASARCWMRRPGGPRPGRTASPGCGARATAPTPCRTCSPSWPTCSIPRRPRTCACPQLATPRAPVVGRSRRAPRPQALAPAPCPRRSPRRTPLGASCSLSWPPCSLPRTSIAGSPGPASCPTRATNSVSRSPIRSIRRG